MTNIEIYTEKISEEISEIWERPLERAMKAGTEMLNGTDTDEDNELFYSVAIRIVEPVINNEDVLNEYQELMETDSWVPYIKNNFGDKWAFIASVVKEYGY